MSEPRNRVLGTLKVGDSIQIGESIFWAQLQSLDVGMAIKAQGFRNNPIVASELVEFFAVNTGFESIVQLDKRVTYLESSFAEVKKSAMSAEKAAASAANKADDVKKLVDQLQKRVVKLWK